LRGWGFLAGAGIYLAACLFLGGATRQGFVADAVLQLGAVPLLLFAVWRLQDAPPRLNWPLAFCLALVVVPVLQLIPLPPQPWTALPLRDLTVQSLKLAGHEIGWRPLSLTPHATWQSLGALIPPIAIFLTVLLLSWRDRRRLVLGLLGLGLVAGFVGMLQVALGPGRPPIGFGLGVPGEATGFFANRNHFGALLYSLLLFAAAFAINSAKALPAGSVKSWESRALVAVVMSFTVLVALLAAQMMARSRAGIGLTIVALLGIAALATSDERKAARLGVKRLVGGAVALVLLFASQFALYRVLERFGADPLADARLTFARNTWDAAWTLMPFGSGLGSFVPVYQFFEKPRDALRDVFANRAHNDILEVWLETGAVGLVLMGLFAVWVMLRFWRVWGPTAADGWEGPMSPLDRLLVRAASLVVVLLSAHSLVDYPLRTTAMAVLFAVACGLLIAPLPDHGNCLAKSRPDAEDEAQRDTGGEAANRPRARGPGRGGSQPHQGWFGPAPAGQVGPSLSRADLPAQESEVPGGVFEEPPVRSSSAERWAWPEQPAPQQPPRGSRTTTAANAKPADTPNKSQRWGADIAWPEAWRQPSASTKHAPESEPSDSE
jgi:O-antigen ligase